MTFGEKQVWGLLGTQGNLLKPCAGPAHLAMYLWPYFCLRTALWTRKTSEPSSVQPTMMFSTRDVIMNGFHRTTTLPPTERSGVRHREKSCPGRDSGTADFLECRSVASARVSHTLLPRPLARAVSATTVSKDNLSLLYFCSCRRNIVFENFNVNVF